MDLRRLGISEDTEEEQDAVHEHEYRHANVAPGEEVLPRPGVDEGVPAHAAVGRVEMVDVAEDVGEDVVAEDFRVVGVVVDEEA